MWQVCEISARREAGNPKFISTKDSIRAERVADSHVNNFAAIRWNVGVRARSLQTRIQGPSAYGMPGCDLGLQHRRWSDTCIATACGEDAHET